MPGTYLDGTRIVIPGAHSLIKDQDLAGISLRASGIVALLGTCRSGEPQKVHWVTSLEQARAIFGDEQAGGLMEAIRLALSPSPDTAGAALIAAIRVEAATQATHTLQATAADIIDLASVDYGLQCNSISVKLTTGTGYDLGVRYGDLEVTGNIAGEGFTIQYTGAGTAATMTIDAAGLTTTCTGAVGDDLALPWGTFTTIDELIDFINAHPSYTCTLDHAAANGDPEEMLDYVAAVDIKTVAYTAPTVVFDTVAWYNNNAGGIITAAWDGGANKTAPDDTSPEWTYLTGGTTPDAVTQDWTDALVLLEQEDVQLVVAYVADAAVHALVQTHVETMSNMINRKERIGLLGSEAADTVASALSDAATYNSSRMVYVYPGLKHYDRNGNLTLFPGWKVAAQVAGMLAGVGVADALTFRYITARDIETRLSPSDQQSLLLGGVMPIVYVRGKGYRIVQSITTWTGDDNYLRREVSVRRAADYIVRNIREELEEQLLGKKGSPNTLGRAISVTKSVLTMLERQEIIVGDESDPAFRSVTATLSQDVLTVAFEANVVIPVNYIILIATLQLYEGTVTA